MYPIVGKNSTCQAANDYVQARAPPPPLRVRLARRRAHGIPDARACVANHLSALAAHVLLFVGLLASTAALGATQISAAQVGQAGGGTGPLQLCSAIAGGINPFAAPGLDTDCWLRCKDSDIVGPDVLAWVQNATAAVETLLQHTLQLLWCAAADEKSECRAPPM